ncbi:hypothetical protein [Pseudoponticoccus marisrubri]|uniref:Uncharacterized protein n=1 Tax=Pseudoponticoccus marisrubri TaxID=1685382 RepID=A0A0W7WJN3_9RHOB|nr:hypothetical protein [Pseudoponticoccus marisrubri]KUF10835.1 hypothetical protein AVJ23_10380 [Pseudoponticoccus marisrubri]
MTPYPVPKARGISKHSRGIGALGTGGLSTGSIRAVVGVSVGSLLPFLTGEEAAAVVPTDTVTAHQ